MAIRCMVKGEIKCDACQEVLAEIKTSKDCLDILEQEQKYTEIRCQKCREKPLTT